jgi:tetratricopeptide (TPR) repeat protein
MESTENTQPIQNEENLEQKKSSKPRRGRWILLGIVIVLIGGAIGGYFGLEKAKQLRLQEQDKSVVNAATVQFELGVRELANKQYENAQKRFEYVIQIMPNFPGAQEKLTEVMLAKAQVATPTLAPTPTLTPTPDMRGEEELFEQALVYVREENWQDAMATLDSLRELNLDYRTVDVDGLYYLALRNRGVELILNEGSLEPGIYDLSLAETFAPLDLEAKNYRMWARNYLNGASYWALDWSQVVAIFGDLYTYLPYLRDSSGMTTTERYRVGLINWGDLLNLSEEFCLASEKYEMALAVMDDQNVVPKATKAYEECHKPEEEPTKKPQEATPTPPPAVEPTIGETTPTTPPEGTEPTSEPTQGSEPPPATATPAPDL